MTTLDKPFVQLAIEQVDTVISDLDGRYDADLYDRYETFEAARDAALTSIEVMLDEADYDDEAHLEELERMRGLLEMSSTFEDLQRQAEYQWFLNRLKATRTVAA